MNILPSKKQHALLQYIDAFIKENNYAPSYREVMRALDYRSVSTVAKHIDGLIERGWLVKRDNSARSVEVVYKLDAAQGQSEPTQNSPTPALPVDHEAWLKDLIAARLADAARPVTDEERASLVGTLALLGLEDVVEADP